MRIIVTSELETGSRKAHAINVVKTAGGFARLGHDVTLICREGPTPPAEFLRSLHEPDLEIETVPPDRRDPMSRTRQREFAGLIVERARELGASLVYARHFEVAIACARADIRCVLETHAYVGDRNPQLGEALCFLRHGLRAVVTISERLRRWYAQLGGDPLRIAVVPDGVDVELFERPDSFEPSACDRPRVVYSGHLYDYKGIPTVLDSAMLLPDTDFLLIGGLDEDIARVRREITERALMNVNALGWLEHRALPEHLRDADALLLPVSAREASKDWTSPVKLGEYLASGSPIVCSDIPALRDWVNDSTVSFFEPDNPLALSNAIEQTLSMHPVERDRMREAAMELARRYSYASRANAILRHAMGDERLAA